MRTALVTGGNKGIGKAIVARLAATAKSPLTILLTSRNEALGREAVESLKVEPHVTLEFLPLDISKPQSIAECVAAVQSRFHGLDALINNAGIATKGPRFDGDIVRQTLETNFTGTVNTCLAFLPLLRPKARLINISSSLGRLAPFSPELQAKLRSESLTLEVLNSLMGQFEHDVRAGDWKEKGWPSSAYGVSKAGVTAFGKVLTRMPQVQERGILVASVCPGWVKTDLAGPRAPGTVEEGAETPVWLASELSDQEFAQQNGDFFRDKNVAEW